MKTFREDLRKWFDKNHPEGGWKRINSKGEAIGPCAREPGEAKPKCMSNAKRASLSKKERAAAVAAKRRHDPVADRSGKGGAPVNVSNFGKGKLGETVEPLDEKSRPTSPEKWARAVAQARAKFDVYPSAYANGWAAKWYKKRGGSWRIKEDACCSECGDMNGITEEIFEYYGNELYEDWGEIEEENEGKKLNKPFLTPGGPKKRSVYVKNEKGNVVKVNFGDPNMTIKRDDPERRKSFRARHGCDNPGPKTKANYWSCKFWSSTPVSKL